MVPQPNQVVGGSQRNRCKTLDKLDHLSRGQRAFRSQRGHGLGQGDSVTHPPTCRHPQNAPSGPALCMWKVGEGGQSAGARVSVVFCPEAYLPVWPGDSQMGQGHLPSGGWGRAWAPTCWPHGNEHLDERGCLPGATGAGAVSVCVCACLEASTREAASVSAKSTLCSAFGNLGSGLSSAAHRLHKHGQASLPF